MTPAPLHDQKATAWLSLAAVILVDGSYLLVLAVDEGARLTLGSNLLVTLFVTPLPVGLSGLICLGMTRGSQKAAKAGRVMASILVVVAFVFAALKLGAVGSYGNEMDGAVVVVEIGITTVLVVITLVVALVVANRGSG